MPKGRVDPRSVCCQHCGQQFTATSPQSRYCGPECRAEGARRTWREYGERNRDAVRARGRRWYADNKAHVAEKVRRYWQTPAGRRARAESQRWAKKNPEGRAAVVRRRRARKMAAEGTHTAEDVRLLMHAQRGRCAYCKCDLRRLPTKERHVDHIQPLSKEGPDHRRNLQLLCGPCNRSKGNADPAIYARRIGLLI